MRWQRMLGSARAATDAEPVVRPHPNASLDRLNPPSAASPVGAVPISTTFTDTTQNGRVGSVSCGLV